MSYLTDKQTAGISALLFVLVFSLLRVWATTLASTERLTILGGFVSSLLFFFSMLTLGNLQRESGWFIVFVSLILSMGAAATVHRVCVTTCFLFSMGLLYLMNTASKRSTSKVAAAQSTKSRRK